MSPSSTHTVGARGRKPARTSVAPRAWVLGSREGQGVWGGVEGTGRPLIAHTVSALDWTSCPLSVCTKRCGVQVVMCGWVRVRGAGRGGFQWRIQRGPSIRTAMVGMMITKSRSGFLTFHACSVARVYMKTGKQLPQAHASRTTVDPIYPPPQPDIRTCAHDRSHASLCSSSTPRGGVPCAATSRTSATALPLLSRCLGPVSTPACSGCSHSTHSQRTPGYI